MMQKEVLDEKVMVQTLCARSTAERKEEEPVCDDVSGEVKQLEREKKKEAEWNIGFGSSINTADIFEH